MDIKNFVKKWDAHTFSTGGETGEDYKSFQRSYKRLLKEVADDAGYELYQFSGNHYEFSAVLRQKDTGAFAYISIPDVRFWRGEWHTNILYRQMKHARDWTGGPNNYASLDRLSEELKTLYR